MNKKRRREGKNFEKIVACSNSIRQLTFIHNAKLEQIITSLSSLFDQFILSLANSSPSSSSLPTLQIFHFYKSNYLFEQINQLIYANFDISDREEEIKFHFNKCEVEKTPKKFNKFIICFYLFQHCEEYQNFNPKSLFSFAIPNFSNINNKWMKNNNQSTENNFKISQNAFYYLISIFNLENELFECFFLLSYSNFIKITSNFLQFLIELKIKNHSFMIDNQCCFSSDFIFKIAEKFAIFLSLFSPTSFFHLLLRFYSLFDGNFI